MAPQFPQRRIGDDLVSAVGLGCMGMSIILDPNMSNAEESLRVLTQAADIGINFWVTSDRYGPFTNEELIGRWFKETGRRDEIFLASKFGTKMMDGKFEVNSSPQYVKESCEASLKRLNTDRIDLYSQHRVDPATPIEKTVAALAELKKEGKIRHLGLSECSARTLRRAHAVHPIAAAEMEFSLFALEIESPDTEFLSTARELDVKVIAYSPLGRGLLTGAIRSRDDFHENDPRKTMFARFSEENFAGNLRLVEGIDEIAKEKGCTTGQLALAWLLAQGEDIIPIPGTKHVKYLKENAGGASVSFSKDDENRIRKILDGIGGTKGARYPAAFMAMCFADSPELDNA